jgi:hypothetical protein
VNAERAVLEAFERGKAFGFVEGMKSKQAEIEQLKKELTEAGGMIGVLREYISDLENGLDSSIKLNKAQAERNKK